MQHILLLAANTILFCFYDGALLKSLYKMAASSEDKRTPITTPQYQVSSDDVTPDPPTFSLDTTVKLFTRKRPVSKKVTYYELSDRISRVILGTIGQKKVY